MNDTARAYWMLLLICGLWGISFPIMEALLSSISPLLFVFVRYSLSAMIVTVIFHKRLRTITKLDLRYSARIALPFAFAASLQMLGLANSSSTNTAFITGMTVIVIPIMMWLTKQQKLHKTTIWAIVLSFIGVFLMSGILSANPNLQSGDLLVFLGTIAFALQIIQLGKLGKKVDYAILSIVQFYMAALVAGVLLLWLEPIRLEYHLQMFGQIGFIVIVCSVGALLIQNKYQHHIPSTHVGVIFLLEPVTALLFSLVLGYTVSVQQVLGAGIILLGMLLVIMNGDDAIA